MDIEMGDDRMYSTTSVGRVTFKRDSGNPLTLKDVLCVPSLNKNLVFVAMLEDVDMIRYSVKERHSFITKLQDM